MKILKQTPAPRRAHEDATPAAQEAGALALSALMFLARDMDRIERFLALTGMDPGELRANLHAPGFQLAVLDHIAGDESLLLQFAEEERLAPEAIGRARRALGGGE